MAACGGGSSSSSSGGSAVAAAQWQRQRSAIRIASIFGEKRPILCVTEKKVIPIGTGLPESISKSGMEPNGLGFIPIWGPSS